MYFFSQFFGTHCEACLTGSVIVPWGCRVMGAGTVISRGMLDHSPFGQNSYRFTMPCSNWYEVRYGAGYYVVGGNSGVKFEVAT